MAQSRGCDGNHTRRQQQRKLTMNILKPALLGFLLLLSGAAFASVAPPGNGHVDTASYASPEGNGHVGDTASYAAPEGNGHIDIA
jgi:hypothetical protein